MSSTHPRWREDLRFLAPALLLLLALGLYQLRWGERISAGHGLGWDGRFYSRIALDFPQVVLHERLDGYRLQRVVAPGAVYLILQALRLPHDDFHVVQAFAGYNLALLLAGVLVWNGIAHAVGLSEGGRWLGFLLLFGNFANLKMPFYYPVLTDTTAFFLGGLLVYFHLRANALGMLAVLALGAFSWPSFAGLGALLYLFPYRPLGPAQPPRRALHWVVAGAACLVYSLALPGNPHLDLRPDSSAPIDRGLLPISVPIVLAYLTAVLGGLLRHDGFFRLETYRRGLRLTRLGAWLLLLGAAWLIVQRFSNGSALSDPGLYLRQLPVRPLIKPGLFLVAHATYLGVVVLILILCWPRVCRAANRLGLGVTLFVTGVLLLGLTPESRQILHGLTALALLAVLAVDDLRWPRWGTGFLVLAAAAGSKLWFSLNQEGFLGKSDPFGYPAQYYYMNHGPWMTYEMYGLHGSLAAAAGLVLYLVRRRERALSAEERQASLPVPRVLVRLSRAAVALAFAAVLVESAARRLFEGRNAPPPGGDGSRASAALGWDNAPGAEVRVRGSQYDVRLRFNSLGLRGPERSYEKPGGTRRVLLLGDSFAEGYNVADQATARAVLERTLEACRCEVVNAGVAGYSTDQEYLSFKQEAYRHQPDVVVLLFFSDDLYHNLRGKRGKPYFDLLDGRLVPRDEPRLQRDPLRQREQRPSGRHLWHGSAALRLLSDWTLEDLPRLHRLLTGTGLVEVGPPPPELWPYGPREEVREMWRVTQALLGALRSEVEAAGARLVILYVPARLEVNEDEWQTVLRRYRMSPRFWKRDKVIGRLQAAGQELGVPVLDPREPLRRAEASPRPAYLRREGLWTEAGHEVAAHELAAFLTPLLCAGREVQAPQR